MLRSFLRSEKGQSMVEFALVGVILSMIICMRLHVGVNKFVLAMIFCGLVGMLIPGEILKGKSKKYQESIRLDLPDVMDLLVVSVEAGLGFDAALMRLYERNKTVVMEQLIQATRDIQRGVSKREAYLDLAQRCKVKELTTFLTAMIQADQLGTSIQTVLRSQAEVLRNERKRTAARKAKEAPIDVVYINKESKVVQVDEAVPKAKCCKRVKKAKYLIEFPEGTAKRFNIKKEDMLEVK